MTDHDQNLRNVFLDYPRETLQLLVPRHARDIHPAATVTPVREEVLRQLPEASSRPPLVPLLVEEPDRQGRKELFVLEEETEPDMFAILQFAMDCVVLSDLIGTRTVVPVMVFRQPTRAPREVRLEFGGEIWLYFRYVPATLGAMDALQHIDSANPVARLTLPIMHYPPERKLDVHAAAIGGLLQLEADAGRRTRYAGFIDIHASLSDDERVQYRERYPEQSDALAGLTGRFTDPGGT